MSMATKLAGIVIYLDRLLIIKSYKALIMWTCKVTWQTKTSYLYYKSVYGNQTWQNDSFPWWALTYNVAWPFDHMVLWDMRFTYTRRFSTQTLKSSPTSCWYLKIEWGWFNYQKILHNLYIFLQFKKRDLLICLVL